MENNSRNNYGGLDQFQQFKGFKKVRLICMTIVQDKGNFRFN